MKTGDKWKEWTIESLLGQGSFGKVYKISRTDWGGKFESALKVIRIPQNESELSSIRSEGLDEESVEKFFRSVVDEISSECALMYKLRGNSNIVSYEGHEIEEIKDGFGWNIFIQMELLTPLVMYMKDHSFTAEDTLQLGIDMCRALEECSRYGIIHRDIKPENIFVSDLGTFKLGDFGIARTMEQTSGMSRKGTVSYMAPEVYKSMPYNSSVDIYSLGIMMYRLMNNNRAPFMPPYPMPVNYADGEAANAKRLRGEKLPAPCLAGERLSAIILKACAYDAASRYSSAAEMRKDLEALAEDLRSGKTDPVPETRITEQQKILENYAELSKSEEETQSLTLTLTSDGNERPSGTAAGKMSSDRKHKYLIPVLIAVVIAAAAAAGLMLNSHKDSGSMSKGTFYRIADEVRGAAMDGLLKYADGTGETQYVNEIPEYRSGFVFVSTEEEFKRALDTSGQQTIVVMPGDYNFDEPLTIDKELHIKGCTAGDGEKPSFNCGFTVTADGVILENLDINVGSHDLMAEDQSAVCVDSNGRGYFLGLDIGYAFSDPDLMLAGISTLNKAVIENCSIDISNGSMCKCISDGSIEGLGVDTKVENNKLTSSYEGIETNAIKTTYDSLTESERSMVDYVIDNNKISAPVRISCYSENGDLETVK